MTTCTLTPVHNIVHRREGINKVSYTNGTTAGPLFMCYIHTLIRPPYVYSTSMIYAQSIPQCMGNGMQGTALVHIII